MSHPGRLILAVATSIILVSAIALALILVPSAPATAEPVDVGVGDLPWPRSTPEEQGIRSQVLLDALTRIRDENLDVHSVIIIRNGHVILEAYVYPYTKDALHNVKSVSKSVISSVAGIALDRGVIESLDQKVADFFPQYFPEDADPRKKEITLRHLLTMTAGLDLDENGPKMGAVFASDDWIETTFSADVVADPGTRFVYSTPLTHTMSGILTESSGKSLLELSTEYLFDPLGVDRVQWSQGPKGYYFGGAELFLTPRDMAKFGMLFLNGGRLGEKQVVPSAWVEASTSNRLEDLGTPQRYGYWWWPQGEGSYAAMGWGGQGIGIHPSLSLVAVGTAADPQASHKLFGNLDPPSGDEPLPPDPKAYKALQKLIHELEHPEPRKVPDLPELAAKVTGVEYVFDENRFGLKSFSFAFAGGESTCTVSWDDVRTGRRDTPMGLDGLYRLTVSGTFGKMPDENVLALRGRWVDGDTFEMETHWLGDPTVATWLFTFGNDLAEISVRVRPSGDEFSLSARKAS